MLLWRNSNDFCANSPGVAVWIDHGDQNQAKQMVQLLKINGWNLKITPLKSKNIFKSLKSPLLCSMLIFQGVQTQSQPTCHQTKVLNERFWDTSFSHDVVQHVYLQTGTNPEFFKKGNVWTAQISGKPLLMHQESSNQLPTPRKTNT